MKIYLFFYLASQKSIFKFLLYLFIFINHAKFHTPFLSWGIFFSGSAYIFNLILSTASSIYKP